MLPAKWHIPIVVVSVLITTGQIALVLAPAALGEATNQASELVYMHNRLFDPVLGRFIGPDKISPKGNKYFNSYSYSFNSPATYSDPSGLFPEDIALAQTLINNVLYLDIIESVTLQDSESTPRLALSKEWRDIYRNQVAILDHIINLERNNISSEIIEDVKIQYDHISYLAWELYRKDPNSSGANIFLYVRQEGKDNSPPPFEIDNPQKPKGPRGNGPKSNLPDLGEYDPSAEKQKPSNGNGSRPHVSPRDLNPYAPVEDMNVRNFVRNMLRAGVPAAVIAVIVNEVVNPDTTSAATRTLDPQTYNEALARLSGHNPVLPPHVVEDEAQCYGQVHAAC